MGMNNALGQHWPEYLMEVVGPGVFMISSVDVNFLVSIAAANAALTIIANALRVGDRLLDQLG